MLSFWKKFRSQSARRSRFQTFNELWCRTGQELKTLCHGTFSRKWKRTGMTKHEHYQILVLRLGLPSRISQEGLRTMRRNHIHLVSNDLSTEDSRQKYIILSKKWCSLPGESNFRHRPTTAKLQYLGFSTFFSFSFLFFPIFRPGGCFVEPSHIPSSCRFSRSSNLLGPCMIRNFGSVKSGSGTVRKVGRLSGPDLCSSATGSASAACSSSSRCLVAFFPPCSSSDSLILLSFDFLPRHAASSLPRSARL